MTMTNLNDTLTEDEFLATYPLIPNHINPDAAWEVNGRGGCLFDRSGREFAFVRQQDPCCVWTLFDACDGRLLLGSGLHIVNRLGYLISTVPVPMGMLISVYIDPLDDDFESDFDDIFEEDVETATSLFESR